MEVSALMDNSSSIDRPQPPSTITSLAHILLHALLIALCVLSLIALWDRAPIAAFVVFVVWIVCFYLLIFILAWHGIPRVSILTVLISRLRDDPRKEPPRPATSTSHYESIPFPGPYSNQPPYRPAQETEYPTSLSHADHTAEDYCDDEDDDERQRQIEEEISRRDVNIVTVPRRKLVVTNPGHS